jgi:hypothetical protein
MPFFGSTVIRTGEVDETCLEDWAVPWYLDTEVFNSPVLARTKPL